MKKYYVVGLIENIEAQVMGKTEPVTWAEGQIGAMAVFSNKAKAKKYAGKDGDVMEVCGE